MEFREEDFKTQILELLKENLSPDLHYHNMVHTLDIYESAVRLSEWEGIEGRELLYVKVAAILHDVGFLKIYNGHEAQSCVFAREKLPSEGLAPEEVEIICGMIMATRLPQNPKNHLEEILCDADLDYLGRGDYDDIAPRLFREINARDPGFGEEDWLDMQLHFLSSHQYYTDSAKKRRQPGKELKLKELKALKK